jgi:hypothetical protein
LASGIVPVAVPPSGGGGVSALAVFAVGVPPSPDGHRSLSFIDEEQPPSQVRHAAATTRTRATLILIKALRTTILRPVLPPHAGSNRPLPPKAGEHRMPQARRRRLRKSSPAYRIRASGVAQKHCGKEASPEECRCDRPASEVSKMSKRSHKTTAPPRAEPAAALEPVSCGASAPIVSGRGSSHRRERYRCWSSCCCWTSM